MIHEVKAHLQRGSEAFLGTLKDGQPFVSGVGYLYEPDDAAEKIGTIYLLLSDLAQHTRNIKSHSSVSLLVVEPTLDKPIHEKKRATLMGRIERIDDEKRFRKLKEEYQAKFPRSEIFFQLPDFRFYGLEILETHWIGGFGKAAVFH